jgi:TonB-linked SusC/RagA family outer membrane protein
MRRMRHANARSFTLPKWLNSKNFKPLVIVMLTVILQSVAIELQAQTLTVTGKITDSEGKSLPGTTILIKGTSNGVVSNLNGEYTISNVPETGTLMFSFIGMLAEEVNVEGKTNIDVTLLPDLIGLDEVVVVGYGTMKKADLTGSVSTLSGDDLTKQAVPNITSTLAGKMTGVITRQNSGRPGGDSPSFIIRGQSTTGNNDALVLVDGIERDFNNIDPNDIESITILKDAASAAIYGSRAANGVVLVTTKRGADKAPEIVYSGSFSRATPTFSPKYMNAGNYAKYVNEARINSGGDSLFSAKDIQDFTDGTRPGTDWWGTMMSKYSPMQQHNLSATGGNERANYFLSLGVIDQKGLYDAVSYKRYNVRSNIDTKISDNLSVGLDFAARTDYTSEGTVDESKLYQTLQTALPYVPAYVPDSLRIDGDNLGLNSNGAAGSPMGEAMYSGYKKGNNVYFETKMSIEYKFDFIKGLKAKFDYSYDKKFYNFKQFNEPYTLYFYTYENGLTNVTPSESMISLEQSKSETTDKTLQAGFNYDNSFGLHNFGGALLFEQNDYRFDKIWVYREGFISSAIDQIFAGADLNKDNDGYANESARRGYIGRFTYNYANKYYFQANARYDGSYIFPQDSRWGMFPAFSAGWRISEESFMKDISLISNLKFRASWGKYGNDRVDPFQYLSGYEYNDGYVLGSAYTYYGGIRNTGIANPNITWEKAIGSNIGFEFGLLENRITGEFDYFRKNTKDILVTRSAAVPATFGASLPDENVGEVANWGYEGILRYKDTYGEFKFGVEGNITYATSKVINIVEPADVPEQRRLTGQPFDVRVGYISEGLFQSEEEIKNWAVQDNNQNKSIKPGDIKYKDTNNDSVIDGDDRIIFGQSSTPKLVFGLNLNASYKNFSLTAGFQGAAAYDNYKYVESFQKEYNSLEILGENSWRVGNEGAKYPRLEVGRTTNNNQYSSFWMYDGFYIKLRTLDLSYTFINQPVLNRIGIKRMVLSISGRNLLTIGKNLAFDPENPNMNYPIMRTYTAGISVTY